MSANINLNISTNKFSFYSRKEVPWHGLGQIVQDAKTSDEVIELAQLNWQVQKLPIYCQYPLDSNFLDKNKVRKRGELVANFKAVTRMDTGQVLGSCSDRYEVLNNIDAFNFIDNIVGEKLAVFETAGALGNGEVVFVTAKLPTYIRATSNKDDIIEQYLLFTTTHDGSGAVQAMFTPIRVVCNNTLNMALRSNSGRVKMRHTKNLQDKIKNAREIMGLYAEYSSQLNHDLAVMATKNVDSKEIDFVLANTFLTSEQLGIFNSNKILLNRAFPVKTTNNLIYVKDYIEGGPGQEYSKGTAYWLYNGITTFVNNGKEYNNNEDRFVSLTSGNECKIAQKAYNIINELCLT